MRLILSFKIVHNENNNFFLKMPTIKLKKNERDPEISELTDSEASSSKASTCWESTWSIRIPQRPRCCWTRRSWRQSQLNKFWVNIYFWFKFKGRFCLDLALRWDACSGQALGVFSGRYWIWVCEKPQLKLLSPCWPWNLKRNKHLLQ